MKYIYIKSKTELKYERERNRKKRGECQYKRMLQRYESECVNLSSYVGTAEEIEEILSKTKRQGEQNKIRRI